MTQDGPSARVVAERKTSVQILLAGVVLSVFFPCGMLLHEAGHYLAAKHFGYSPKFSYRLVTYSAENMSKSADTMIKAAGPCVDVLFVVTGLLLLRNINGEGSRSIRFWIGTALILSAMRWLKAPFQGQGVSDEARISALIGIPWWVVPTAMFIPTVIVLTHLLFVHYRHRTLVPLMIGFGIGMLSFILWYREIGPRLLPA